ncbi:MAG: homoserine kinase, partial [Chloroflexi bacterium]|nr:homoserine kinase [Chloroflexota bacterium]
GGAANSNYILRARQGDYVLTVFEEKTLAEASKLGQLLLLLQEHAYPSPRLLLSAKGNMTTTYKGKAVMIKVYIVGRVYQDLDEVMLRQVGAAMARLHQLPVPDFLPDGLLYGVPHLPSVMGRNIDPEYKAWVTGRFAYLDQRIPAGLPQSLIHSDVFYDNVLFVGKKFKAIIDFDDAVYYYKAFDLGMGMVGMCQERSTLALDKARALVEGYQQVRALEEREKQSLQLFAEYGATAISCWRFWKYHIHTPTAPKAHKHWQMVRLAREIGAIPEAKFLKAIFG